MHVMIVLLKKGADPQVRAFSLDYLFPGKVPRKVPAL